MTKKIEPAIVRKLLRYDSETGKLFWLARTAGGQITEVYARRFNTRFAGKEAFTAKTQTGYLQGHLLSSKHAAHRVIWVLVYGKWPVEVDRSDNRLDNLREVDRLENCKNASLSKRRLGCTLGVRFSKGAWQASITCAGQRIYLGRFQKETDAISARKRAERDLGFHPNHGKAAA